MAAIDKKAFLSRIASKKPAGDAIPGESAYEEASPTEESSEGMTCGEQLKAAIDNGDTAGIDAALREAVAKYSNKG